MTLKKLIKLWEELGDIPINNKDEIQKTFQTPKLAFTRGVNRFDIWHWFDNQLEYLAPQYTINDLMFHKIKGY